METSRQIELAAAEWIARRDAGDWSPGDQVALDSWVGQSIAHRVAFIRLDAAWQQSDRLKVLGAGKQVGGPPESDWMRSPFFSSHDEDGLASPKSRIGSSGEVVEIRPRDVESLPDQASRRPVRFIAFAATLALVGFLGLGIRERNAIDVASYATGVGDMTTVPLADGSSATLSSDSKVDVALSRGERHIDLLQGEVFFKVAKDASRPFVVRIGNRKVTAVGTQFAVRREGAGLRVVVTEGIVRLDSEADVPGPKSTLLPAGSVAMAGPAGFSVHSGSIEATASYLSWRDGYLVFEDTPLKDAAAEFNRYSTTKIVIADPVVASMRVGGNFRYANLEGFVRLLELGFPVRAERHGDQIVLTSK